MISFYNLLRSQAFLCLILSALFLSACASRSGKSASQGYSSKISKQSSDNDSEDEDSEDSSEEVSDENIEELDENQIATARSAKEIQADRDAANSFPLVENEFVDQWLKFFTEKPRGRATYAKWLSRYHRYSPLILKTMKEDGLPQDLIFLAMIESGFSPKAHSKAAAVGVWQFIAGTGKRYGLHIDHWVDERRDIVKSTHAAAAYLKELHQIFGSWYLAAASYNAGEGRTLRVVRENKTRNFWQLIREKKNFRAETRHYVPKMIAAALIAKNPEKYGFTNIDYEDPLVWEEVEVKPGVDLRSISRLIDVDFEHMKLLNPVLRRGITPPDRDSWMLRIPPSKKEEFLAKRDQLESKKAGHFVEHKVRRGENLGAIARKYGVSLRSLMDLNNIKNPKRVRVGTVLQIPVDYSEDSRPVKKKSRSRKPSSVGKSTTKKVNKNGVQKSRKIRSSR